jgi:hypothetical protein
VSRFTIYSGTDIHGSESCSRTFLAAGKFCDVHGVILVRRLIREAAAREVGSNRMRWRRDDDDSP